MSTLAECQREYDSRTPEDADECPLCDGEMRDNGYLECGFEWGDYPEYEEEK